MLENLIAERYAKSWIDLAQEKDAIELVLEDVRALHKLIEDSKDFALLMRSPIISVYKKITIWEKISVGMHPITQVFVALLIRKGRELYLRQILATFIEQYKVLNGIVDVVIYSPIVLAPNVLNAIEKIVQKRINAKSLEIQNKIRTSLIGGFVLQFKDKVIDLSIAKRLQYIQKQISA